MKLKPLLVAITATLSCSSVFAASLTDSVGIENSKGKKVILHKLEKKENYYSIGRKYNVKPFAIMQYNNNVALHIGDTIGVPTELPFVQPNTVPVQSRKQQPVYTNSAPAQQPHTGTANNQASAGNATQSQSNQPNPPGTQQYKVSAGETLYAVSRRFGTTVDNLVGMNNLKGTNLTPGQILLVPNGSAPAPVQQQPVTQANQDVIATRDSTTVASADSAANSRRTPAANRYGLFEKSEKGVATWMDDTGLDPNKKLVLHRTAPIGTVIKITNPMTNRTTFAKVVGRFTDNESTKDVLIVMTKNAAESLGALDRRFRVSISYGIPDNE